jgi:hypothetical protein
MLSSGGGLPKLDVAGSNPVGRSNFCWGYGEDP